MTKTQGALIILLLICLLISTTAQLMVSLWIGYASNPFLYTGVGSVYANSPTLTASLDSPRTVKLSEEFDLVVETTNTEETPIRLYSIDISYRLLDGFEVVSVSPEAVETTAGDSAYRSWQFSDTVDPGESLDITVRLKAVQVGRFSGDFDVNNPDMDYQTVFPIIRVVDEAEEDVADGRQSSRPVRQPLFAQLG